MTDLERDLQVLDAVVAFLGLLPPDVGVVVTRETVRALAHQLRADRLTLAQLTAVARLRSL